MAGYSLINRISIDKDEIASYLMYFDVYAIKTEENRKKEGCWFACLI